MSTGLRIVASFAAVLLIMLCMSLASLWRLHAADQMTADLVADKLNKQQLTSELLGAARLGGLRVAAIARSDSLEVADYFLAELASGDRLLADTEARLAQRAAGADEEAQLATMAERKRAFLTLRAELFRLKEIGRSQDVSALVEQQFDPVFGAYIGSLTRMLELHTGRAEALVKTSARQYKASWTLLIVLGCVALATGAFLAWALTRGIVLPLQQAGALAEQVAAGNLGAFIIHRRSDEIGQLFDSLSNMTATLKGTVGQVRDGALAIDAASREIALGNLDLSRRTEQQAGALEETASSMAQLSAAVKQNSSNAHAANQLARVASDVAGQGGKVVADVVHTMDSIKEFAHQIVDITGVIDSIAFQTNILALNAAVEAARAGEQGRGFAVVATEVRALAQRSAGAARQIKQLIGESVAKIASGSEQANQAGATMDQIMTRVAQVTAIMAEISSASRLQEDGIEQVGRAIDELDQVTQQNAALVEQAAAAASSMQDQAGGLTRMVNRFVLDGPAESGRRVGQPDGVKQAATLKRGNMAADLALLPT